MTQRFKSENFLIIHEVEVIFFFRCLMPVIVRWGNGKHSNQHGRRRCTTFWRDHLDGNASSITSGFAYLLIHLFTYSFIHLFFYSLIHLFTYSSHDFWNFLSNHSFIGSYLTLPSNFINILIHFFRSVPITSGASHLLTHSFMHSLIRSVQQSSYLFLPLFAN